jgi:ComF family protein
MLGFTPVRVCSACVGRVRAQGLEATDLTCSRCGDALGMESARFAASLGMSECTACRLAPPPFARAVSFGLYDAEMREMLHTLKFGGMQRVADHVLGEWMGATFLKLEGHAATELVVVPVPLFRDRERERGFNQAHLLARAGVKRAAKLRPWWKLELRPDALERVKDTRALYALRPDQRRRGLRGAFRIGNADAVRNREVVLVDDILTTGATARECAKVLLRAGATKVWVVTVARAQPESIRAVETSVARWDPLPSQPAPALQGSTQRAEA